MLFSANLIDHIIDDIRNRRNKSFEVWALYEIEPETFIEIVRWLAEETQEERVGKLSWARAVGLIVPHHFVRTLGGGWKTEQTGPAELHRLTNHYHDKTCLAYVTDFDTGEPWHYHSWPHLTLQDIADGKCYPLEISVHPHPELAKYLFPDQKQRSD